MRVYIKLRLDHYKTLSEPKNRKLLPYYLYMLQFADFQKDSYVELDMKKAADVLKITPTTLYRYNAALRKLNIIEKESGHHGHILHPKEGGYVAITKKTFQKILTSEENPASLLVVYLFLKDRAYHLGSEVYYSQNTISKNCGMTTKTAMKLLVELRLLGVIYCTKNSGVGTLNYTIIEKAEIQERCAQQYKELRKKRGFDSEDTEEQEEE